MKLTSVTYDSEALMPDWIFNSTLQLTEDHIKQILTAESNAAKKDTYWGWTRQGQSYTQEGMKLARLIGTQFVDIMTSHFNCEQQGKYLVVPNSGTVVDVEFSNMHSFAVRKDHGVSIPTSRCFYVAMCYLQTSPSGGHSISLSRQNKYGAPGLIPESTLIAPEALKIVFVPGMYYPMVMEPINASSPTVMFQANIITKRVQ